MPRTRETRADFPPCIRLICGDADDYYLNEAVALLQKEIEALNIADLPEGRHGYVKMIPNADHSMIFLSPPMQNIPREMLDHLARERAHFKVAIACRTIHARMTSQKIRQQFIDFFVQKHGHTFVPSLAGRAAR